jgi:hypothetical protein
MKVLLATLIIITAMNTQLIFDFNKDSDIRGWEIVDDVVMGGRSMGQFSLTPQGFGLFEGRISLENNGGFSSVRYRFEKMKVNENSIITLKLKGDGKTYQLRIKNDAGNYFSYITAFTTSGEWQKIEISLKDMYPSFRGRRLDQPNFSHEFIEEIAFLIGNKKPESFKLFIDKMELN